MVLYDVSYIVLYWVFHKVLCRMPIRVYCHFNILTLKTFVLEMFL